MSYQKVLTLADRTVEWALADSGSGSIFVKQAPAEDLLSYTNPPEPVSMDLDENVWMTEPGDSKGIVRPSLSSQKPTIVNIYARERGKGKNRDPGTLHPQ
jgi:hypothetical protein